MEGLADLITANPVIFLVRRGVYCRGAAELDASKALGIDFPLRDYPECPAEKSAPLILWGRQPPLGGITI